MKEIKYGYDRYGLLTTPCPHQHKSRNEEIVRVGSGACSGCPHWFGEDENNCVVQCLCENAHSEEVTSQEAPTTDMKMISADLYDKLEYLGIIDDSGVRGRNFGASDYNEHTITVWSIWLDYPNLSEFEKMMIKYLLREKDSDPKILDLQKVIHYAEERIRQLEWLEKNVRVKKDNKAFE